MTNSIGFDYAWGYNSHVPAAVKKAGGSFVVRYVGTSSKCIRPTEAGELHAAKLTIGMVYETTGITFTGGTEAGKLDGAAAKDAAQKLGAPAGSLIWFAIDTDTADYTKVAEYLTGATEAAKPYVAAVYAGAHVVDKLPGNLHWQTYAWSSGEISKKAALYQYDNGVTVGGVSMDKNRTLAALGTSTGWFSPPAPPKPNPVTPIVAPVAASAKSLAAGAAAAVAQATAGSPGWMTAVCGAVGAILTWLIPNRQADIAALVDQIETAIAPEETK